MRTLTIPRDGDVDVALRSERARPGVRTLTIPRDGDVPVALRRGPRSGVQRADIGWRPIVGEPAAVHDPNGIGGGGWTYVGDGVWEVTVSSAEPAPTIPQGVGAAWPCPDVLGRPLTSMGPGEIWMEVVQPPEAGSGVTLMAMPAPTADIATPNRIGGGLTYVDADYPTAIAEIVTGQRLGANPHPNTVGARLNWTTRRHTGDTFIRTLQVHPLNADRGLTITAWEDVAAQNGGNTFYPAPTPVHVGLVAATATAVTTPQTVRVKLWVRILPEEVAP